jgi:hypothetical protein
MGRVERVDFLIVIINAPSLEIAPLPVFPQWSWTDIYQYLSFGKVLESPWVVLVLYA